MLLKKIILIVAVISLLQATSLQWERKLVVSNFDALVELVGTTIVQTNMVTFP